MKYLAEAQCSPLEAYGTLVRCLLLRECSMCNVTAMKTVGLLCTLGCTLNTAVFTWPPKKLAEHSLYLHCTSQGLSKYAKMCVEMGSTGTYI